MTIDKAPASRTLAHQFAVIATLLGILSLTWAAYQPAIPGVFMFDDFDNLGALGTSPVTDLSSLQDYLEGSKAGPLGRPISKLSFLIDDNAWPSHPGGFKRTNLLLHLLNGVLLFALGRLLLRLVTGERAADWLALTAAALWLLHPMQVSTVMYVVQRMAQLATLFVVSGVLVHTLIRLQTGIPEIRRLLMLSLSLGVFTTLAALSKESGVLLPIYLLVLELTLLAALPNSRAFTWWRRIFLSLPAVVLVGYLAYLPKWLPSYATRDFSLAERLITQPVVLWDYIYHLFTFRVTGLGLFQDDYPVYGNLLDPAPLAAFSLLVVSLAAAITLRRRLPLLAFAVLWFIGGHLLESTTVSLEFYFEHRNYLPIFGPLLAVIAGTYLGLKRVDGLGPSVGPAVGATLLVIAAGTTWGYARDWGAPDRIYPIWAAEHPGSARAQRTFASVFAAMGDANAAVQVLEDGYSRFPDDLAFPLMSIQIACQFRVTPRHHLQDLVPKVEAHRLTDGLRPVLTLMTKDILDTDCRDSVDDLHALIAALERLPGIEVLPRAYAGFLVLDGDLYLKEGKAEEALAAFLRVDEIKPSADSALRLAALFTRTGQYGSARAALHEAQRLAERGRTWYGPSRDAQYEAAFARIDTLEAATAGSAQERPPAAPGERAL